jgi:hypothetical protein
MRVKMEHLLDVVVCLDFVEVVEVVAMTDEPLLVVVGAVVVVVAIVVGFSGWPL